MRRIDIYLSLNLFVIGSIIDALFRKFLGISKEIHVFTPGVCQNWQIDLQCCQVKEGRGVAKARHISKVDLFESSSKLGVVEPSHIPWNSPVLLVKKSSGKYRFCFDGRKLNDITKHDSYPFPRIDRILNQLRDAQFISSVDLRKAFWQVPLDEASKEKTAFSVPGRALFQFSVMPFGVRNAARTQARQCDALFGPRFEPHVFTYLDDIIITSSTFEKHVALLYEIKNILKEANCLALPAKRS
ncbi:hypothetical protein JTB14_028969 [Gonioctena quinquepunctata]|nr:hypothetical protein JTB14_028969 [Gonioctena quinquepunctata]